jgi:hypothetical protein
MPDSCEVTRCPNCGYSVCCGEVLPPECPICGCNTRGENA